MVYPAAKLGINHRCFHAVLNIHENSIPYFLFLQKWRHDMDTFSTLFDVFGGKSTETGAFIEIQSFDVFLVSMD